MRLLNDVFGTDGGGHGELDTGTGPLDGLTGEPSRMSRRSLRSLLRMRGGYPGWVKKALRSARITFGDTGKGSGNCEESDKWRARGQELYHRKIGTNKVFYKRIK